MASPPDSSATPHTFGQPRPDRRTGLRWLVLVAAVLAFILVPFALFGDSLDNWSVGLLRELSERPGLAAALVVGLLASDVVLPIPSSVVSTLAGVLLGTVGGAATSAVGMTIGCLVGYGLGRGAGREAVHRLVGRSELDRLELSSARHGDWALVVARAVPVLAEASTVFAGVGSVPLGRFVWITGLANVGISLVYASVGAYAAQAQSFFWALGGAILVPALAMALLRGRR